MFESIVRTGVGVYELTCDQISLLESVPQPAVLSPNANVCAVNVEVVSPTLVRVRTSASSVAFDVDFALSFQRFQTPTVANGFIPSPAPPGPAAGGVASVTAGAGLINSGTAANPILDVVAANTSITVNADSIQVGPIVPTAIQFTNTVQVSETMTLDTAIDNLIVTQAAQAGGAPQSSIAWTGGAHTNLNAGAEVIDISINGARIVQHATGAIASQRMVRFTAPTYSFVAASTITTAAVLAVSGPAIAGANATITHPLAVWLEGSGSLGIGNPGATAVTSPAPSVRWYNGNGAGLTREGRLAYETGAAIISGQTRGYLRNTNDMILTLENPGASAGVMCAGYLADTTGGNAMCIGSSGTAATGCLALGINARASGATALVINAAGGAGAASNGTGTSTIIIGSGNSDGGFTRGYLIGDGLTSTANDQMQIRTQTFITGNGDTSGVPVNVTHRITNASGATVAGANLSFEAGRPTNAIGGSLIFRTAPASGVNGTLGTLADRLTIAGDGTTTFTNAAINFSAASTILAETAADAQISIRGNRNAATNAADVIINTTNTRTAGVILGAQNNGTNRFQVLFHGGINIPQGNATSGTTQLLALTSGTHTGQTAGTEVNQIDVNISATTTWQTGAIAAQRFVRVRQPTIAFNAASTVTDAATLSIDGAPVAGANATLTRSYALWIQAGGFRVDGNIGFFNTVPVTQQVSGANLTNNVTAGGTNDQIDDYNDLVVYANDAAAIRNDIYQLARKLKQVNDGLRAYGMLT